MIFKPSYTVPYLTSIDSTLENIFSCHINSEGGTTVDKYSFYIKDLNGDNIYSVEDQTLSPVKYNSDILEITVPNSTAMINGTDYIWSVRLYESSSSMWVTYGVTQTGSTSSSIKIRNHYNVESDMYIKIGNETRKISTYVQATGVATLVTPFSIAPIAGVDYTIYSDFIDSEEVYFKARTTPVIAITNYIDTIISKQYNFLGSYTQSEGVGWKYYKWNLYNSSDVLVATSGTESSGEINFNFDGLLKDTNYKIELIIENQEGIIISSGKQSFDVVYAETKLLTKPGLELLTDKNAIKVYWEQPFVNLNEVTGVDLPYYDYLDNEPFIGTQSINMHIGSELVYNISTPEGIELIPYQSTTFLHVKFPVGFEGDIIRLENTDDGSYYSLRYIDGSFLFDINGRYVGYIEVQPPSGTWLLTNNYNAGIRYIWDDNAVWEGSYVWGEQTEDILSDNWWKFTLLPTNLLLTIVPIYHENAFNPIGFESPYSTRLYADYKLINTDVLYN